MKKEYVVPEVNSIDQELEVMIATSQTTFDASIGLGGEADADSPVLSRENYNSIWDTGW